MPRLSNGIRWLEYGPFEQRRDPILRALFLIAVISAVTPAAAEAGDPIVLSITAGSEALHLEPGHIENIDAGWNDFAQQGVTIALTDDAATSLAQFTERHVGEKAAVVVCGETVIEPVIRERISGGLIYIGTSTPEDAETLADRLWLAEGCEISRTPE